MNPSSYGGLPGPGAETIQSFTEVLLSTDNQAKLPGGVMLKQGYGLLKKGTVIGIFSSGGKAGPYASTVLTVDPANGATSITVANAANFRIGDTLTVGTEVTPVTISNIVGNVITLAVGIASDQANGAAVEVNDGRKVAVCILDNDQDTTLTDMPASGWIAGIFDSSKLIGLDNNAKADLKLCYFG